MDEPIPVNGHAPDGYAVLQLRPGASRELIEEAYWALVGEVKAAALTEPAFSQRVDELNHAYEMLASAPVAARQIAPSAQRRGLSLRRRPAVAPRAKDFYELLHIHADADPAVVHVAARSATERVTSRDPARDTILRACAVLTDADERRAYDERRANGHAAENVAVAPHTNGHTNGHAPAAAITRVRAPKRGKPAAALDGALASAPIAVHDAAPKPATKTPRKSNGMNSPARRNGAAPKAPAQPSALDHAAPAEPPDVAYTTVASGAPAATDEAERSSQPARVSVAVHDTLARIASIVPHRRPELEAAMAEAENDRLLALRADEPVLPQAEPPAENDRLLALRADEPVRPQTEPPAENDRLLAMRADAPVLPRTESPAVIERPVAVVEAVPPARLEPVDAPTDTPAVDESPMPSRPHSRLAARIVFESGPVAGLTLPVGGSGGDNESVDLSLRDGEAAGALLRVVDRDGIFVLIHIDGPNAIVGGQEMTLPVLVLDDGDTIAYGESVARFQLA